MNEPAHSQQEAPKSAAQRLKIATLDFVMRVTPGLRGFRMERAVMLAELRELRTARDKLLRGMALLLKEKSSRDAG